MLAGMNEQPIRGKNTVYSQLREAIAKARSDAERDFLGNQPPKPPTGDVNYDSAYTERRKELET
jgi:hypothetical protein